MGWGFRKKEEKPEKLKKSKAKKTFELRIPGFYVFVMAIITFITFEISTFISGLNYAIIKYRWFDTYMKLSTAYCRTSTIDYLGLQPGLSNDKVLGILTMNLPVVKTCSRSVSEGCWPKVSHFADGSEVYSFEKFPGFVLKNDIMISGIQSTMASCSSTSLCSVISIDLNGYQGPNTFGKDQVRIYYYSDKIVPYFSSDDRFAGTTVRNYLYLK